MEGGFGENGEFLEGGCEIRKGKRKGGAEGEFIKREGLCRSSRYPQTMGADLRIGGEEG